MAVKSTQNTVERVLRQLDHPSVSENSPQSSAHLIDDKIVRIDAKTNAGPRTPHVNQKFNDYVQWLAGQSVSQTTSPNVVSANLPNPKAPTAKPTAKPTAIPTATPTATPTIGPTEVLAIAEVTPTVDRQAQLQNFVVDTETATRLGHSIRRLRIDNRHTQDKKAIHQEPHIVVDQPKTKEGRAFGAAIGVEPVSQPATLPKNSNLANWEVPDFRWPSLIESVIYKQPQLAALILNKSIRFVRPNAKRLAVIGNGRRQGATTMAMCVSRWAAENGSRVLLVDADLANPDLGHQLGLDDNCEISWQHSVANNEPLADAIVQSNRTGVCLLPLQTGRKPRVGSIAILDSLGSLVNSIQSDFDLIVIDAGSANQIMNSLSHASLLADTAMLVHNRQQADSILYDRTCQRLSAFGIQKLVVAENFSAAERSEIQ